MRYVGGKNQDGTFQRIISMMPPHTLFIEAFLGSGAILRNKKPAERNIGIEIDKKVYAELWKDFKFEVLNQDALYFLTHQLNHFLFIHKPENVLIYLDPPYLQSVRSSKHKLYQYEFMTEKQHTELLTILKTLKCKVLISGYDSELYNDLLADWRKEQFPVMTRGGLRTETVWLNFPEPAELHDYQFLGRDKTDRQRIKRKIKSWTNKLKNLDTQERYALMSAIEDLRSGEAVFVCA